MYTPKPGTKQDPVRRWNLYDRAFFGHGACHILAFVYLERFANRGFYPEWIKPGDGFRGNHVFVTNGDLAFDYRGYLCRNKLLAHHNKQYSRQYPGWNAELVRVESNLCNSDELAALGMYVLSPAGFLHDPLPRAKSFLSRYDKQHAEFFVE
jgi:hypothetical protein